MTSTHLRSGVRRASRITAVSLTCLALVFVQSMPLRAAPGDEISREHKRMRSEAALFDAYLAQLARVQSTDFANENAARAQLAALERFEPDDVVRGYFSSLVIAASRNRQFEAGIKQKAREMGPQNFVQALLANPGLISEVPGSSAAESDVRNFADRVKRRTDAVSKKAEQKFRQKRSDIQIPQFGPGPLERAFHGIAGVLERLLFVKPANASVIAVLAMIVFQAGVMILSTYFTVIVIQYSVDVIPRIYRFIEMLRSAYSDYGACLRNASRQTDYWAKRFHELSCYAVFRL